MTDHFSSPVSGFASFLPEQYRGEFSQDWLMGLSPFEDNTCAVCFSVRQGQWVTFGMREAEERFFKCERVAPLTLPQLLGQERIVLRIPIQYKLSS